MNEWIQGITDAVAYIEDNLTVQAEKHSIAQIVEKAAEKAYLSNFYFQKIFHALCGITVGEYIRNRRLTLAAQALCRTDAKVVDTALQYGYDSPDSFARAFMKFHGTTPSAAKEAGRKLNAFAPVKIKLVLEGGTMLEYKIVEKPQFTVVGTARPFNEENAYREIPKFWQEHMNGALGKEICGAFGICLDSCPSSFNYWIADLYQPWQEIPQGCETKVIPAGSWAVFPCHGALPHALQTLNTRIWSEWLPACKAYKLAGNYNIEFYAPQESDTYTEIWIPVEKV